MRPIFRDEFASVVIKFMTDLYQAGYESVTAHESFVTFSKYLVPDVQCQVQFDLLEHEFSGFGQFHVHLFRILDTRLSSKNQVYKPLSIPLSNLLHGYFELDMSSYRLARFIWLFSDKQDLIKQLGVIEKLLFKYGVPWLEDPESNMGWI